MALRLLIIGDTNTGKTSFVRSLRHEKVRRGYNIKVEDNITELKHKDKYIYIIDENCVIDLYNIDCAIIMLSDNDHNLRSMHHYRKDIKEKFGDIPILVVFSRGNTREIVDNYNLLANYSTIKVAVLPKDNSNNFELIDILLSSLS